MDPEFSAFKTIRFQSCAPSKPYRSRVLCFQDSRGYNVVQTKTFQPQGYNVVQTSTLWFRRSMRPSRDHAYSSGPLTSMSRPICMRTAGAETEEKEDEEEVEEEEEDEEEDESRVKHFCSWGVPFVHPKCPTDLDL